MQFSQILWGILFAILLTASNSAFAFFDATIGRFISRDPIQERGGMNLYGFVKDNAVCEIDKLGLDIVSTPSGVVANKPKDGNYLIYRIRCPKCQYASDIQVKYNEPGMLQAMYNDILNQNPIDFQYYSFNVMKGLAVGDNEQGFGGLDGKPKTNCNGDPVEVDAYMRSRLVGLNTPLIQTWRDYYMPFVLGSPVPAPGQMLGIYEQNTFVIFNCVPCGSGK